ncbi:putative reverse transcriptase domain-containing protein [Tanacetum coccineum]
MSRIIPDPAGIVQAAKLLKQRDILLGLDGAVMSTQEYMKKVVEDVGDIKFFMNNGKLDQVVAIVKSCSPNVIGDLTVTMKDLSGTIHGTIHHTVIDEGGYGNDITVGAALILANVSVFSPKPSMHYLNITMRNVVKVFRKDTVHESVAGERKLMWQGKMPDGVVVLLLVLPMFLLVPLNPEVVVDTLSQRVGISAKKETPVNFLTDPSDGRSTLRPANVLVFGWVGGKHACVDLTGVSPLVGLSSKSFTTGQAALKAASCKVTKHEKACIENQHVFIPFAFDTFCFLAPEAVELLSRVQRVMHNNVMTPRYTDVVFKRIGCNPKRASGAACCPLASHVNPY